MRAIVRHLPGLGAAVVALSFCAMGSVRAESGEVAGYASHYDRLLAFIGGSSLTSSERASVDSYIATLVRTDPVAVRTGDARTRAFLAKLASAQEWFLSEQREQLRVQFELLPARDTPRVIVDAHDPTIAFDAAHKRIVTERSLIEWRRAYVRLANLYGVSGPSDGFVSDARHFVQTRYASLPDNDQSALAHVERNYPVAIDIITRSDPRRLAAEGRVAHAEAKNERVLALDMAELLSASYKGMIDELVRRGALMGSAENYNMLYHRGYSNGNYR